MNKVWNSSFKRKRKHNLLLSLGAALLLCNCGTLNSMFGLKGASDAPKPISNPFSTYDSGSGGGGFGKDAPVVLRTRKGDRSIEVEIPSESHASTDYILPLEADVLGKKAGSDNPDSMPIDDHYLQAKPTFSDREILSKLPKGSPEEEWKRQEIEEGLGLVPSEDRTKNPDGSFLAQVDHVKQLFRTSRYEAALIEVDHLVQLYPTHPRIYEMRGTLLDRLGHPDLALKAWDQALELNPGNLSLKTYVDKRRRNEKWRKVASP